MKYNKILCLIEVVVLIIISLCGCTGKDNSFENEKMINKYTYQSSEQSFVTEEKNIVSDIDHIADMIYDHDNIYIIGQNYSRFEDGAVEYIDLNTDTRIMPEIVQGSDVFGGAVSDEGIFIMYEADNIICISSHDKTGRKTGENSLPEDCSAQGTAAFGDSVYCMFSTVNIDSSRNFIIRKYDRTLNSYKDYDMNKLLDTGRDTCLVSMMADKSGNIYIQEVTEKTNQINMIKLSSEMEVVFNTELDLIIEDMSFQMRKVSEKGISFTGLNKNEKVLYENVYSKDDGKCIEVNEYEIPADVTDVLPGLSGNNICILKENSLISLNDINTESLFYQITSKDHTSKILDYDERYILVKTGSYSREKIAVNIFDYKTDSVKKFCVETDTERGLLSLCSAYIWNKKIYILCYDEENDKNLICSINVQNEETEWFDFDEIFDVTVKDAAVYEGKALFLTEKNNENGLQSVIVSDSDNPINIINVIDMPLNTYWDGFTAALSGKIYIYNDTMFRDVFDDTEYREFINQSTDNYDVVISAGNVIKKYCLFNNSVSVCLSDMYISDCFLTTDGKIICYGSDYIDGKKYVFKIRDAEMDNCINIYCLNVDERIIKKESELYNDKNDIKIKLVFFSNPYEMLDYIKDIPCDAVISGDISSDRIIRKQIEFCNLGDFENRDSEFSFDKMISGKLSDDSEIYGLYPSFSLTFFSCCKNSFSSINNIENLITLLKENNDRYFSLGSKTDLAYTLLGMNSESFVNYSENKCSFSENSIFDKVIELTDYLNENEDEISNLNSVRLNNIYSLQEYAEIKGENIVFVPDNRIGNFLINPDFCFSICEKSKYKDEIWSFFKIFFSEDYQKQLTSFSVMSDLYKNKTNEKDMEVTEDFLNEIVNANIEYGFEKEISDILLENLNYYFENRLSFIELQNYLDGKIGIYLKETNYSKS